MGLFGSKDNSQAIQLGDKVKCRITGYTGIVTARAEYINGCVRFIVCKDELVDGELKELWFDEQSIAIVEKNALDPSPPQPVSASAGGPTGRGVGSHWP